MLGANERGRKLLRRMASEASLPVVVRPAAARTLGTASRVLFDQEVRCTDLYTLAYPNDEVRLGFINSLIPAYLPDPYYKKDSFIYSFTESLRRGDIGSCMQQLTAFFASIPYDLENRTEKHYHTIFYLLFSMMGLYVESEVKSAAGRADIVLKTATHIYVFELKVDGSAEEALRQIDSRGYLVPYTADGRELVKVGVNFDSATRTVSEWKAVEG